MTNPEPFTGPSVADVLGLLAARKAERAAFLDSLATLRELASALDRVDELAKENEALRQRFTQSGWQDITRSLETAQADLDGLTKAMTTLADELDKEAKSYRLDWARTRALKEAKYDAAERIRLLIEF